MIAPPRGAESTSPRCHACQSQTDAARCEHCGVAQRVGNYLVERTISQSARGRVYLARDRAGALVALKELVFAVVPDAKLIDSFEREAALLAQLRHPRIPRYRESFREGQGVHTRLYIAQEYVAGTTLLELLTRHRFAEAEVLDIGRQVLEVIAYLQGLSPRVVHRDIKPANLIQREDGSIALVDFGVARDSTEAGTHGATMVGTFGYMPPEQLGGTLHPSADLYALGASLIHLLSRTSPDALLGSDLRLRFEDEVNASPGTVRFLRALTARRIEDRYPSAEQALCALSSSAPEPAEPAASGSGEALENAAAAFSTLERRAGRIATGLATGVWATLFVVAAQQLAARGVTLGPYHLLLALGTGVGAFGIRHAFLRTSRRTSRGRWLVEAAAACHVRARELKERLVASGLWEAGREDDHGIGRGGLRRR